MGCRDFFQYHRAKFVVLGGFMIHLVLGTFYLWGGISNYCTSYLRSYDPTISIDDMNSVFPFMGLGLHITMPYGERVGRKIGMRRTAMIVIALNSFFLFSSSFTTGMYSFIFLYGLVPGLVKGFCYLVPIYCGWQYFPQKKGKVSGIIMSGYGLGTFIFNFVATHLANPHDLRPTVLVQEGHNMKKYFDEEVYQNAPTMLRGLAFTFFLVGFTGACLLDEPSRKGANKPLLKQNIEMQSYNSMEKDEPPEKINECPTPSLAYRTRTFQLLCCMSVLSSSFGFFISNTYKNYGFSKNFADHFMTVVGSVASLCNGTSRLFWGWLVDHFSFTAVYRILITGMMLLSLTLASISDNPTLYMIWVGSIMFHEGGHFSMYPTVTNRIFGGTHGYYLYGIIGYFFTIANFSGYFMNKIVVKHYPHEVLFYSFSVACLGALILTFWFSERVDWEEEKKKRPDLVD